MRRRETWDTVYINAVAAAPIIEPNEKAFQDAVKSGVTEVLVTACVGVEKCRFAWSMMCLAEGVVAMNRSQNGLKSLSLMSYSVSVGVAPCLISKPMFPAPPIKGS